MNDTEILKLFKAVQLVNLDNLKLLLNICDISVNSLCHKKSGDSLMHVAARTPNSVNILRYLIEEKEGNIELTNLDGKTALHDAAQFSNEEAVEYLLSAGANVNAVKKADWTPLMLACTKQNYPIVKSLLENKADPLFVNKDGWNSFQIATREGNLQIIQELLELHGNRSKCSNFRDQLCHSASRNGRRPIHTAAMHGRLEVVKLLFGEDSVRSDVDVPDQCGTTALMDACRFGHAAIVDLLVNFGANLQKSNRAGMNCLHIAAEAGQCDIVKHLVTGYHLDVNCGSIPAKLTCLHWAVKEEQISSIRTLLELRACADLTDAHGLTCLDLAMKLRKKVASKILEKYFISKKVTER